jgi:hypothetical protein
MGTKHLILAVFGILANLSVGFGQSTSLITTFTNPTPASYDYFGFAIAAVSDDTVVIGAPNDSLGVTDAGAAYLFATNGTLLTTFANPDPVLGADFGSAVATVGGNRVLIGAPFHTTGMIQAGIAYLFSTNGTLLTTLTNPAPDFDDRFGFAVATVGTSGLFIGAPNDSGHGVAYLFGTNGTLLAPFINPTPTLYDFFGYAAAAIGSDRILISAPGDRTGAAYAGSVYLFSTNGALLTTFTNPTPAINDQFGCSLSVLGNDRVIIGALTDDTGATDAGAAYLYNIDGTLLTTFTNPFPSALALFGASLAAVESDRVLIGAPYDNTGATYAGAAYLFNTNGTLLTAITNPTPVETDEIGIAVAAMGGNLILIGAPFDNTDEPDAGSAYLFKISSAVRPSLAIGLTATNTVIISWPSSAGGFTLQQNTNSITSASWSNVITAPIDDGTNNTAILVPPLGNCFYRLFKP